MHAETVGHAADFERACALQRLHFEVDVGAAAAGVKAKFSGGQRCWNGPARSLSVEFECHGEETILDVTEPSVCEYTMRFGTPAVCHPSTLEALEKDLGEVLV